MPETGKEQFKGIHEKVHAVSVLSRVMREWRRTHSVSTGNLDDRECLLLEMIGMFPSMVTQEAIRVVFGLSEGSASALVAKLNKKGLIEQPKRSGPRATPLALSEAGRAELDLIKHASSVHYNYLFSTCTKKELSALDGIAGKIYDATLRIIRGIVFRVEPVVMSFSIPKPKPARVTRSKPARLELVGAER